MIKPSTRYSLSTKKCVGNTLNSYNTTELP